MLAAPGCRVALGGSGKTLVMHTMLLSAEEVTELTDYCYPSKQITWLREHGYTHEVGGDGRPKLLRTYVYSRLDGVVEQSPP